MQKITKNPERTKSKLVKPLYILFLLIFIGIVGFRIAQNIYSTSSTESSINVLDSDSNSQDLQIEKILKLQYVTTTTTTTTTTEATTTSTTGPLNLNIVCDDCYVETKCTCELQGTCDQGTWAAKNKEGTPLDASIIQELPPEDFAFTPNETGKVDVKVVCTQPPKPTGDPRINTTTVEVKLKFLDCPSECDVDQDCTCNVNECKTGKFTATQGDSVLVRETIDTESFESTFVPLNTKEISAEVACVDPIKTDSKKIMISGAPPPSEDFTASNFVCESTSSGYKCSIDYTNNLPSTVIVFTFAKPEVVDTKEVTVSRGSGTAKVTFSCSTASGTIHISWKAYKPTDRKNAIAWSISTERQIITC
jgi:hypothetical protein